MRYIISILFTISCYGQTLLNETFSTFYQPLDTVGVAGFYMFDSLFHDSFTSLQLNQDIGNRDNDLTQQGFGTFANELGDASPLNSGTTVLHFTSASSQYFNASNPLDFIPFTGSFTIDAIIKIDGSLSTTAHIYPIIKKGSGDVNASSYLFTLRAGAPYNGMIFRVGDITNGLSLNASTNQAPTLSTGYHHVAAVYNKGDNTAKMYVDFTEVASGDISSIGSITTLGADLEVGKWNTTHSNAYIPFLKFTRSPLSVAQMQKHVYLAKDWSLVDDNANGGVVRSGWGFNQGIVSDTIYYNTALTAGNWTITLSDSAASGVNYEVLTSADATTWTTLASGTTGTSWGSKSYSGAGTGYVAIAVASGTAFFDNLVVSLNQTAGKKGFGKPFTTGFPKPFK